MSRSRKSKKMSPKRRKPPGEKTTYASINSNRYSLPFMYNLLSFLFLLDFSPPFFVKKCYKLFVRGVFSFFKIRYTHPQHPATDLDKADYPTFPIYYFFHQLRYTVHFPSTTRTSQYAQEQGKGKAPFLLLYLDSQQILSKSTSKVPR